VVTVRGKNHAKTKHRKKSTERARPSAFGDDPDHDSSHDAIDRELLGIWLSISRLRQLIGARRPDACVIALRRAAAKKDTARKPRRKAA